MKIVLATGIYPPDIGGPATYVRELARELVRRGIGVVVVTYGREETEATAEGSELAEWEETEESEEKIQRWPVVWVSKSGGPFLRWWRYAGALRTHAADVDVVLEFSLVSVGVPLWWAGLRKPKNILRLGGDFLWERYTDCGGGLGLREWYGSRFWRIVSSLARWLVHRLLCTFNDIVFSTKFQEEIYEKYYRNLPRHSVIENAVSETSNEKRATRNEHKPFRLLYLGRFVSFKNISALLRAMTELPGVTLTLVGEGPLLHLLEGNVQGLHIQDRVIFRPKVNQEERNILFRAHDLLVIPSVTEISPNSALEARVGGLPVLLTEETGLSEQLRQGIIIRKLRTPEQIRGAIREVMGNYGRFAEEAARSPIDRSWGKVSGEYLQLFNRMFDPIP